MQARILWSLLWRSIVWFPLGLVTAFSVVGFPLQVIAICWWAAILFLDGSWIWGLITIGALVPILGARRWLSYRVLTAGAVV